MRGFLKSSGRWLSAGWFWPLVLLALPACGLSTGGLTIPSDNTFEPGTGNLSGAVMCDIPKVQDKVGLVGTTCGSAGSGIMSLTHAAVALGDGSTGTSALDFSPAALTACGGSPLQTDFFGPFPQGFPVCLNCAQQIGMKYPTPTDVCVAKCKELVQTQFSQPVNLDAYCRANARLSTNFTGNCFADRCSSGGTAFGTFADPRRNPEQVQWSHGMELIGTQDSGNTVSQTAMTPNPLTMTIADFQAGAASEQLITRGDAWVEFGANDNAVSQVLGVRESRLVGGGPCQKVADCPDLDPSLNDIGYSIILNNDKHFYVIESNPSVKVHGPFGTYNPGDRFRVKVKDNQDGTATISYWQVTGACIPGMQCIENQFAQQFVAGPKYPLRIDASFREQNGTLANVTVMRIIQ